MPKKSIPQLKDKFQKGDKPMQEDFYDLLDSFIHRDEDISKILIKIASISEAENGSDNVKHMTPLLTKKAIYALTRLADIPDLATEVQQKIDASINKLLTLEDADNVINTVKDVLDFVKGAGEDLNIITELGKKVDKTSISHAIDSSSTTAVASSKAVKSAYDRAVHATWASGGYEQTEDKLQNLPPCALVMGVGTPVEDKYWYIVSLSYSNSNTYKQIAYEYNGNRIAVRYINAFNSGSVSSWEFIATSKSVENAISTASSDATDKMNTREPKFDKKTGFNKDKSDSIDSNDSETIATSKAVKDAKDSAVSSASSDATDKMNTREPKFEKASGFNKDKSDAIDLDDNDKLATSRAVMLAYGRAKKTTETGSAQNQTEDVIQNLPPCKLAMGVGTPVEDRYWYIVSLSYSDNTYKQIAYEYNGNRIAVRYINAFNSGSISSWEFIALENRNVAFKELSVNDVIIK